MLQAAKELQQAEARVQQQIEQYRKEYPGKLRFDYTYKPNAAKEPFLVAAIYHDDRFTYIKCAAQEKPTDLRTEGWQAESREFRF